MASREEVGGLLGVDPQPDAIDRLHQGEDIVGVEPPAEVAFGGRVGDAHGAEGIEIDRVVAPPLDVLEPPTAGEDVECDVQDVVGFVIGDMAFEEMEVVIDGRDQAGPLGHQEHGADAAGGQALSALAEFIVDVGGGDHGDLALRTGEIGDAVEEPPPTLLQETSVAISIGLALAFSVLLGESSSHSKPSVAWKNEDPFNP